jgi:hypothetical protein
MTKLKIEDGQGDQPPPNPHPVWPPPTMVALLYIATASSLFSGIACQQRHHMLALTFAAIATGAGLINIFLLPRR